MERFERRMRGAPSKGGFKPLSTKEKREVYARLGVNPDYSDTCFPTGSCSCPTPQVCLYPRHIFCLDLGNCACSCPAPPKANSHYVSDTCGVSYSWFCECNVAGACIAGRSCSCGCAGLCYYDCDTGWEWDPSTEECVPVPIEEKPLINPPLVNPIIVNTPIIRQILRKPLILKTSTRK